MKKETNKGTHQYMLKNKGTTLISYKIRASKYLLVQYILNKVSHIYNDRGKRLSIYFLLQGGDGKSKLTPALSNEWGRLDQGNNAGVESIDTIKFIKNFKVLTDRKVAYASFVCDHRPLKDKQW